MNQSVLRGRVVSPDAPCAGTPEKARDFDAGLTVLRDMGLEMSEAAHARGTLSYVAATVEERLRDLVAAYRDDSVDFLIAGTGGWNVSQLLAEFPWDVVKANPKPLVGFSDISVLQTAIYAHTGVRQLHAPMVRWGMNSATDVTKASLLAALRGERQRMAMADFGTFVKGRRMEGTIVAGNLVSLATLLGTPHAPDWAGKILCWEETEETIYRLDRALTHFKNAGVWDRLAGMVIGELDQVDEEFNGTVTPVMAMIEEHFKGYGFPIIKTEMFGHSKGVDFVTLPAGGRLVAEEGGFFDAV